MAIPGTVVAEHAANLPASRAGLLVSVRVRKGQFVHKDEVLAELDTGRIKAELSVRQAELQIAQAELAQHEVQVSRRRQDLQRRHGASWIPPEEMDHVKKDCEEAEAVFNVARARVAQREAQIRSTQLELLESALRAPFDGIVAAQYAQRGEAVGPAAPVFRLVTTEPLHVRFETPPAKHLTTGTQVCVASETGSFLARVQSSAPEVDARTGQVAVDALLPLGAPLLPGSPVEVTLGCTSLPETGAAVKTAIREVSP